MGCRSVFRKSSWASRLRRWRRHGASAQEQLATLVPDARYAVAAESAHYIQLQQPELVVDAVRRVVEAVRDPGRRGSAPQ
jgi:pimeloyl-ACP methyl ester carboxylesterase